LTDDERSINTINMLPNIQIIGAQKAGSTAVYTWLHANDICGPIIGANEPSYRIKESHFFDGKHSNVTFYANLYRNCTNYDYTMDATPSAFKYPDRVHETYVEAGGNQHAELKIILTLRDPVSRELSLYNHMRNMHARDNTTDQWYDMYVTSETGALYDFDEYVENVLKKKLAGSSFRVGYYADNIKRWTNFFKRNQILILSYDELLYNTSMTQDRVRKFLGKDLPGIIPKMNVQTSDTAKTIISCAIQKELDEYFDPQNEKLYKLLNDTNQIRPPMEQSPFPMLRKGPCIPEFTGFETNV